MPACSVCVNKERVAIDMALVSGASVRDVAGRYALSRSSVQRHKDRHLSPMLQLKQEQIGDTLYAQIVTLNAETLTVLAKAQADGKGYLVLRAVEQARANLEVVAELLGKVNRGAGTAVIVTQSTEWFAIKDALNRILSPDQKIAFAETLAQLGTGE